MRRLLFAVITTCFLQVSLFGDYLEVQRSVTLKAGPDGSAEIRATLAPETRLELLQTQQENGYYRARRSDNGMDGWVYRTFVRRFTGSIPSSDIPTPIAPADPPTIHSAHCLFGCPGGAPAENDLIVREIYTLSNNGTRKFADWVAYRITTETIGPTQPRNWRADPLLPNNRTLEPEDYDDANAALSTDRGHQAPLASFTGTAFWRDTNLLSNITPQQGDLNKGPWERLESAERTLAQSPAGMGGVFTTTGPLYERLMPRLPAADEDHRVPSGYWKVVAIQSGDTAVVAAFIMEQETPRGDNFCAHRTTVDEIEQRSGLDLFRDLPPDKETALESSAGPLAVRLGCP
jgi:endonuclease G